MSYAHRLLYAWHCDNDFAASKGTLVEIGDDADAEIAALREALENAQARGIHTCHANCQRVECVQRREIAALRAENERLRELLKEADIARRALLEQKP